MAPAALSDEILSTRFPLHFFEHTMMAQRINNPNRRRLSEGEGEIFTGLRDALALPCEKKQWGMTKIKYFQLEDNRGMNMDIGDGLHCPT